ncbi:MAG: SusC/RagA family TonB-linked outer membrane protein [Cyclobacteriaceae bacterium]
MMKEFYKLLRICILLIALMGVLEVHAQSINVTGRVVDAESPEGLPGVNVMIKGLTKGTVTDTEGRYSLDVPDGDAILVFSSVGYLTEEVNVGNRKIIDMNLTADITALEELVVVGYGSQKKANLTGAVDVVKGDVLENRPIVNAAQGLQGMSPNLNVTIPNGDPTANAQFNIRGFESINGGAPLILVDNVPMNLNMINPNDIASLTVLKDGAASAIYGARAAFGVILIETKKGKKGSGLNVNVSSQFAWEQPIWHVDPITNGLEYALERNRARERDGSNPDYTPEYMEGLERYWNDPANNPAYEVVDGVFQNYAYTGLSNSLMSTTSPQQKIDVAISGATERANYYTSFGVLNTDGYINHPGNDNFKRYNVLMKGDFKVNKWLSVDQQVTVNIQRSNKPSEADINTMIRIEPIRAFEVPLIEGYEQYEGMYWDQAFLILPELENGGREIFSNTDLWMKSGITLTPTKRITIRSDFSYNIFNREFESARPQFEVLSYNLDQDTPINRVGDDQIDVRRDFNQYYVFNAYAQYEAADIKNHYFKAMVGFNQEWDYRTRVEGFGRTLLSPNIIDISATTGTQFITGNKMHSALRGAFYRFNYIYKDRYLFETNGRYDATSRFPKEDRFGFFPSASVGWRISQENFMEATRSVIDDLKIRASYGSLGNQYLENPNRTPIFYPYIPSMNSGFSNFIMGSGLTPFVEFPGLVSPNLTWESVITKNIGMDLTLLTGKLNLTFDMYTRETRDMLMRRQYPSVLGATPPQENAANLMTKGWELSVKWRDKIGDKLNYFVDFNLADWSAEITKFDNPTGAIGGNNNYYVGQKLGEIWGYQTVGIIQNEDQLANIPDQSRISTNLWMVGDLEFADLNGDGAVTPGNNTLSDPGDRRIIGNTTPRYSFGINSGWNYKNFSLDIFLQGIGRRDYMPANNDWTWFYPWRAYYGDKSWITDTWSPDNPNAYFPEAQLNNKNFPAQTRYLQDASYIRLKNLNIGYNLPSTLISRIGLTSAKVFVGGQNLWEFTNIRKPLDPEYVFSNSINYPLFRSYTMGLVVNL